MMKTLHSVLTVAGALALLLASSRESQAQAIWYTWDTTTTLAADASPQWKLAQFGYSVTNNYVEAPPAPLKFFSIGDGAGVYGSLAKDSAYWNPGQPSGSTVQFSLKVESQTSGMAYATQFVVSNSATTSNQRWHLNFTTTGVRFFDDSTEYALDVTTFNTYRLTFTDTTASLYVNDNPIPVLTRTSASSGERTTAISIGDPGAGYGGVVHWEYITWTNDGMIAPIPEPGTVAALVMGGSVLLLGFRRRRGA